MRRAAVLGLFVGLGMTLLQMPVAARADGLGRVEGRLANGTAGGAAPAGAEVVLHAFRGDAHVADRPAAAATDGSFAFDTVDTDGAYTYQVTAGYAGVPYTSEPLRFGPGETTKRVDLTVYDTTDTDPGLRVRRASVILAQLDAGSQTIQALELVTLENPSDRAYLPSATGPAGPMGLLRFALPPHAGDLRPGPGLDEAEIVQVDRGFATSLPVPPGTREVLFSYRFPYSPGRTALTRSVPYPTAELRIVVPEEAPTVEGAGLQPGETLEMGEQRYRLFVARDLPAGGQLAFSLGGLPGRWPFNLPLDAVPAPAWGGLGASVALATAVGYARRARRRAPDPSTTGAPARRVLLETLVALDEAFAAGRLPEAAYRARRAAAREQLAELLRAAPASPLEPAPTGSSGGPPEQAAGSGSAGQGMSASTAAGLRDG